MAKSVSMHRSRGKLLSERLYDVERIMNFSKYYYYDFDRFRSLLSNSDYIRRIFSLCDFDYYVTEKAHSYIYLKRINTRPLRLDSVVTRQYNVGTTPTSSFKEKITYEYNRLGQVSRKSYLLDRGVVKSDEYLFPIDLISGGGWPNDYDIMCDNSFLNNPIEVKTLIDNSIVAVNKNKYSVKNTDKGFRFSLTNIQKASLESPLNPSADITPYLEKEKEFLYNDMLRVNQISEESGLKTVILWGYSNLYPIAEIKNADLTTVKGALSSIGLNINILERSSNQSEIIKLNQLRDLPSMKHSSISVFTYEPLIGITSVTDSRGITTRYDYDKFSRLGDKY